MGLAETTIIYRLYLYLFYDCFRGPIDDSHLDMLYHDELVSNPVYEIFQYASVVTSPAIVRQDNLCLWT